MDFMTWLTRWLIRHPLKTPEGDRSRFTAEVMARVRRLAEGPSPAPRPALWRPQWAFAVLAAAGLVVVLRVAGRSEQVAQAPEPSRIQLAESDDWSIEETYQLLEQLEGETGEPVADPSGASEDDWLNELELLEESDLAASS